MPRILFFVFLAFLLWFLIRVLGGSRKPREPADATPRPSPPIDAMTQCAWCGAHMPSQGALALPDGRRYCSAEHRAAATGAADR